MLQRLKSWFSNARLAQKVTAITCMAFAIASLVMVLALQAGFNVYDDKLYENSVLELEFFSESTKITVDTLDSFTRTVTADNAIQELLADAAKLPYPSSEYSYQLYRLRQDITNEMLPYSLIKTVIYIDPHGAVMTVGEAVRELPDEDLTAYLEKLQAARGAGVIAEPTDAYPYLLYGRSILQHTNMSMSYLGSLYVVCDMQEILAAQVRELTAEHAQLFVYTDAGMLYRPEEPVISLAALPVVGQAQGYKIITAQGQTYFMCYTQAQQTGWMFVNVFPYSDIFGQTQKVRTLVLLGLVLLFAIMVACVQRLVKRITQPLWQLSDAMKIVEAGDFQKAKAALPQNLPQDETGTLAREFSTMLDKIDLLIEEDYKKQLLLQDSKYKMLQAQINPHFLYNTLNTLTWLVRGGKQKEAETMIIELGQLLRASLSPEPFATVEQEIALVRSYTAIQQLRYKGRAIFEIDTNGQLGGYLLPRLTLQPLVENAINYGVDNALSLCTVRVEVEERPATIWLRVWDNGPGMEAPRLAEVRSGTAKPHGHGIGLKNLRERLSLLFEDYRFEITSDPEQGTAVEIEIPKKEQNDVQAADRG